MNVNPKQSLVWNEYFSDDVYIIQLVGFEQGDGMVCKPCKAL